LRPYKKKNEQSGHFDNRRNLCACRKYRCYLQDKKTGKEIWHSLVPNSFC